MYVKKNLMLCLAVFALALPLLLTGTASAKYMSDGAVADTTGTEGFLAPTDGICVVSIDASGNMVTDLTKTSRRDCDARLVSVTSTTAANAALSQICTNPNYNSDGVRYAAPGSSTCVTIDGSGYITGSISMAGKDRGAVICNGLGGQLANATAGTLSNGAVITTATKTTANGQAATCIAYSYQFRYQDAAGTPLSFGGTGVSPAASGTGFCYTTVRTGITPTTSCPSNNAGTDITATNAKTGYSVSGANCNYAYGTSGVANAALTKIDGTTYAAAGTAVDLRTLTQGQCLANGASWGNGWGFVTTGNTYGTGDGWTSGTGVKFDQQKNLLNADEGCLHCHSTKAQYNGPAERWKDSYLKTGHKNMLRKVTAGQKLVGPDGLPYTTDGTNAINFTTGTVNVGGTDRTLYYVYGDWMAALPTLVYSNLTGTTNGYTCGACHTTGYQDASNPGVQSISMSGYVAQEPNASFPGINLGTANPKWDLEGITCGRCHNAASGPTSAQVTASSFKTTAPHSTGMGALTSGVGRNNLCFGCHQSIAKNWPAQGGAAGGTTQYDPTLIPTGISHGAASGRDFNGHVLGNSVLNSVHARYAGVNDTAANGGITLNSLGKYDLFSANSSTSVQVAPYNSDFKGYVCFQSSTSASPGMTKADGSEISTKADCEALYGAGAWRADTGVPAEGAYGMQGTCTTCHDVHNSLFVSTQAEKAMRKTCEKCHVDNAITGATDTRLPQITTVAHPTGINTPFDTAKYEESCVVCHMATQAQENGDQNSMPVHVWRINTSAAYNTFPTADQFNGTNGATKDRNAQVAPENYTRLDGTTGTYAKAVWVDLDLACGQCHGGSLGTGATHGAPYISKANLSVAAKNMHGSNAGNGSVTANFAWKKGSADYKIDFNAVTSSCTGSNPVVPCTLTYTWQFGDGTTVADLPTAMTSHLYSGATTTTVTLTVKSSFDGSTDSMSQVITAAPVIGAPTVVSGLTASAAGFSPTLSWNVTGGSAPYKIKINWGDGVNEPVITQPGSVGSFAHAFVTARTYTVSVTATDSGVNGSNMTASTQKVAVTISAASSVVTGQVTTNTATPIANVALTLKVGTVVKYLAYSNASGNFTFSAVAPGTYTLSATKSGFTFTPIAGVVSTGAGTVTQNISAQ